MRLVTPCFENTGLVLRSLNEDYRITVYLYYRTYKLPVEKS